MREPFKIYPVRIALPPEQAYQAPVRGILQGPVGDDRYKVASVS